VCMQENRRSAVNRWRSQAKQAPHALATTVCLCYTVRCYTFDCNPVQE